MRDNMHFAFFRPLPGPRKLPVGPQNSPAPELPSFLLLIHSLGREGLSGYWNKAVDTKLIRMKPCQKNMSISTIFNGPGKGV